MASQASTYVDTDRARAIWADYQKDHDITALLEKAVGIEPISGRIWFGESGLDIREQMLCEGIDAPFYCVRVGHEYYLRKGTRR